ncbi:uncharacterized protein TNCV_2410521 [Trichonephila clavipes]|nr:uncharacterized protein TNCV_2410521 [Trichonephila clavipes]
MRSYVRKSTPASTAAIGNENPDIELERKAILPHSRSSSIIRQNYGDFLNRILISVCPSQDTLETMFLHSKDFKVQLNEVAVVAEWYRYRTVACFVTGSSPVPLKTRRVGQRCTLNLSRAETSSRWCGVVVRRGGCQLRCHPRHLTMVQNYVVRRQKPSSS